MTLALAIFLLPGPAGSPILATEPVPIYAGGEPAIFPQAWRRPPISIWAEPLEEALHERLRRLTQRELAGYPPAMLAANLRGVHLVGRLGYRGVLTGGTSSLRRIWVVCRAEPRYTDRAVARTLHAEFSSILLRNGRERFDAAAWDAANPPGFAYGKGGTAAIRAGVRSTGPRAAHFGDGFLSAYGRSSRENDFNGYAAGLMMNESALFDAARKHARVRAKLRLTRAFYVSFDSAWDDALPALPEAMPDGPATADEDG
ncbi:MAG: hypothetical protein AAF907_00865 [Planctomycetota bacterium]